MPSEFFKKLQPLFEATDLAKTAEKSDKKKAEKYKPGEKSLTKKEASAELAKVGKGMKKPNNVKENATDFFRKYSDIVTEAESIDGKKREAVTEAPGAKKVTCPECNGTGKEAKKSPSKMEANTCPECDGIGTVNEKSVKESYCASDDAKKAEGKKKWAFDDVTEAKKTKATVKAEINATNKKIDQIVADGGRVTLTDPLNIKLNKLKKELATLTESSIPAGRKVNRSSLEVSGVDAADHPDYSDAYFSYGEYTDGTELTPDQLDALTDKYPDIVNELANASSHGGRSESDAEIEESVSNSSQGTWIDDEELADALDKVAPGLGDEWADGLDISCYQFSQEGKQDLLNDANEWMEVNNAPYRFVDCEDLGNNVNWKIGSTTSKQPNPE